MLKNQPAQTLFLFPTPVILYDLTNAEVMNKDLKTIILKKRESDAGLARSNYGGWHSNVDMMVWAEQQARIILETAIREVSRQTADIHPFGQRDFDFDAQMWANVSGTGASNQMHCHPGALWSGVYYVDVGEDDPDVDVEGELLLVDPRFPMNTMYMPELVLRDSRGGPQYSQFPVRPVNGRMVLFPAWLKHSVKPYRGKRERISIAFNLMVHPSTAE
jgi:uncharacterized protein (TIGR02466 family)